MARHLRAEAMITKCGYIDASKHVTGDKMFKKENRYVLKETLKEAQFSIVAVHMSGDGQTLVSGSVDKKVRIYRLENG